MKSFTSLPFFLLFEQIIRHDNPGLVHDRWIGFDVAWERARHSFNAQHYGFALDLYTAVACSGAWTLLVAKEQWWGGKHDGAKKMQQWARPLSGDRRKILAWFAARRTQLEKNDLRGAIGKPSIPRSRGPR